RAENKNEPKFGKKVVFLSALSYHSWEKRNCIENTNGLIRRFLPKGANFDNIPKSDVASIGPRKCLNYLAPQGRL
ncbi:MAG: hypothetical protein LE168_04755, partial [Endomicrobium sp.]|nr:hypothetical protein [Endomicrobium sp.]